jgi:BlaI family transcriptional regulator, penicillinase repressor
MPPSRRPRDASARPAHHFSRRERQIMDVVYRLETATVAEITARLPDPPTTTAVRTMLRILEEKGHLRHRMDGLRNVYAPVVPAEQANRSVLRHVVETFFQGSHAKAMATLLEAPATLSEDELDRLRALIDRARRRR